MKRFNSDDCKLYVIADVIGNYQQISLYKNDLLSELVGLGQRATAAGSGDILLSERNGSGISGTVTWDGIPVTYSGSSMLIGCDVPLSSSSSSSINSISSTSSSSSSSGCCHNPTCYGPDSIYFDNWTLAGNNEENTDNCNLYVEFDFVSLEQQIRVYKHPSRASAYLVAQGQGAAGTINLVQKNSSGLSGTVTWDGSSVYYPSFAVLSCGVVESSSSSESFSSYSYSSLSADVSSLTSESFSTSSSISISESSSSAVSIVERVGKINGIPWYRVRRVNGVP